MNLQCLHWQPRRAFHFGVRGVGVEASGDFAPSDTLFSALCTVFRQVYGSSALVADMLTPFINKQPPFLIGGGYPYIMLNQKPLRFYPTPTSLRRLPEDARKALGKSAKARWLSEAVFQTYVATGTVRTDVKMLNEVSALVTLDEHQAIESAYAQLMQVHSGKLPLWVVDDVSRNALDRVTNAANIYRAGRITFAEGGGLWVGVVRRDEAWCKRYLDTLIEVLADEGVGGERSSGYGQFMQHASETVVFPDPVSQFVTLAYVHPQHDQEAQVLLDENSAYGLDVRRGWMSSPDQSGLRRKSVRMITPGSVLGGDSDSGAVYGGLANVTPDEFRRQPNFHEVYRYGYALPIGIGASNE